MQHRRRIPWLLLILAFWPVPLFAQCNQTPVAIDDQVDYFGKPISSEPMANDSEPDGEALALSLVSHTCGIPTYGRPLAILIENGTLRLLPLEPGYPTTCTVTYRIEDERGFTAQAQVQIRELGLFSDGFETGNTSRWESTVISGSGAGR